MATVAVIIPYYQNRAGILRRALDSVMNQRLSSDVSVDIIVVDDGSPHPARLEIEGFFFPSNYRLILKEQENAGVAVARNTALRSVSEDTVYIAFLDSDDIWDPEHLPLALLALNQGCDFYFCDSQRIDNTYSSFAEKSYDQVLASSARSMNHGLYELEKEPFLDQSLLGRVFLIPAVVYRRAVAPDLTFNESRRAVGEDCLFLLLLVEKCRRIVCSPRLNVTCADGVNIYAGNSDWNNPGHLVRYMGQILAFNAWKKELCLGKKNEHLVNDRLLKVRKLFCFLSARYFLKKREKWSPELMQMVRSDSQFWFWYPVYLVYVGILFPLRRYSPLEEW